MRQIAPMQAIGFAVALAVATVAFAPAARALECEGVQRVFEGELQTVKGDQLVVDNKKGDKIKFTKPKEPVVLGQKSSWDDLSKGDWLAVCFKTLDRPRWAYQVEVVPAPTDEE